jgi:hypothetical protein
MQYTPPNTVTSPRDCVSNINVIFDGGTGSSPFSVAKLDWDGTPCIAMRWNVGQTADNGVAGVTGCRQGEYLGRITGARNQDEGEQ